MKLAMRVKRCSPLSDPASDLEALCQMTELWSMLVYIRLYFQVSRHFTSGGIGVKVKDETWNTHQWLANPRRLAIKPSKPVLQNHCVRCGRDFVTAPSSNSSYAVFVS